MQKKKILFTIQWYGIPAKLCTSANTICDERIIEDLKKNSHYEIHILSYGLTGFPMDEVIDGVYVHRFKRPAWWNHFIYTRFNQKTWFDKVIFKYDQITLRLKQLLFIPIYPDITPFHSRHFAKEAEILFQKHNFDLVISEHNGRDTTYAAYALKKSHPEIKYIPILWDPMSGKELAKYLPQSIAKKMLDKDENKLLSLADLVIEMQSYKDYQEEKSHKKSFFSKLLFLDIPGIIKPNCQSTQDNYNKKGYINILYSGIITLPERDPSYLIDVINHSKYADKVNLMFFSAGKAGMDKVAELLKTFKGKSLLHSYIPKNELDIIAYNADILVNLGGSNPRMVPSKIFEYMSLCKPVVSTYFIDNECSLSYFSKYPLAMCLDIRLPLTYNVKKFEYFVENKLTDSISFEEVERTFPANTPKSFNNAISGLLSD